MGTRSVININLLQVEPRIKPCHIRTVIGVLAVSLILLMMSLFYSHKISELAALEDVNTQLQQDLIRYDIEDTFSSPYLQMSQTLDSNRQNVAELQKLRVSHADKIIAIYKIIPSQVMIAELGITEHKVLMKGFCADIYPLTRFVEGLESLSDFIAVSNMKSQLNTKTHEIEFSIELDLEEP